MSEGWRLAAWAGPPILPGLGSALRMGSLEESKHLQFTCVYWTIWSGGFKEHGLRGPICLAGGGLWELETEDCGGDRWVSDSRERGRSSMETGGDSVPSLGQVVRDPGQREAVTQRNEGGQPLRPCLGRLPTLFLPFLVLKLLGLEELVHKN